MVSKSLTIHVESLVATLEVPRKIEYSESLSAVANITRTDSRRTITALNEGILDRLDLPVQSRSRTGKTWFLEHVDQAQVKLVTPR